MFPTLRRQHPVTQILLITLGVVAFVTIVAVLSIFQWGTIIQSLWAGATHSG